MLMGAASFIITPYASHMFTNKAVQKLYTTNSKIDGMIKPGKAHREKNKLARELYSRHRAIKFDYCTRLCLFIKQSVSCILPESCYQKSDAEKMLDIGQEQMESEFDIVKIAKNIRTIKTILKE